MQTTFTYDEAYNILGYFGAGGVWGYEGTLDFEEACGIKDTYNREEIEAHIGKPIPDLDFSVA